MNLKSIEDNGRKDDFCDVEENIVYICKLYTYQNMEGIDVVGIGSTISHKFTDVLHPWGTRGGPAKGFDAQVSNWINWEWIQRGRYTLVFIVLDESVMFLIVGTVIVA